MDKAQIEKLIDDLINKEPKINPAEVGKMAYKRAVMRMALEAAFNSN